jgi:PAS domain S-box-containing protein
MTRSPPPGLAADVVSEIERTGNSLRRQFLSIIAGVIVLSAALLILILVSLRTQAIRSGERLTESLAHVIAEQTNSSLQTINLRLQLAASQIAPLMNSGLDEAQARTLLADQIRALPHLRALSVADPQGRIVYSTAGEATDQTVIDREYFQIHLREPSTGFLVGPPVRSRVSGSWVMTATLPVRSSTGDLVGVLIAAVDPSYFDQVWGQVEVGEGGSIALFRRDGVLMMRSPFDERAVGQRFPNMPVFTHLRVKGEGSFHHKSPIDGNFRILAYRSLSDNQDLVVVLGRAYSQVLSPWRQFANIAAGIWVLAVSAIVLLAFFLDRAGSEKHNNLVSGQQMAQRLILATEASSIGVWDWDLKADRWYATPTYFAMLGYGPDEGVGLRKDWLASLHPDDREAVAANIQAALEGADVPYRHNARVLHADGSYRWVSVIGRVLERDEQGKPSRLLGVMMDITEMKRAEETVREREELFSSAFEHAPIGMALVSPDGRWLRVNGALCDLVGYSDAELRARTFQDITHPDDLDADLDSVRLLLAGETSSYQMEKRYLHASGRHVNVLLSVSLVRDNRGAPHYMIAQIQDITDRKRASAALETSLREKEGLLKEVHHRVKNNLQVITSLLRLEAGRSAEPATRAVLKDMRGRIHSMALLHEMLYRTANFARVELADYLRQLATQLVRGQNAAPGAVSLSLDLKPVEVDIDRAIPAALIVNELLSNSLKHAFPEGRAGEVRLALDVDSAGLVRLCVSDTGVGLSPDFETRRTKSLGLQLVSDLSRQLGGDFEIDRTPETRFTVTFPLSREGPSAP